MLILHFITTLWSGKQGGNIYIGKSNEARELKVKGGTKGEKKKQGMDEIEERRKMGRLRYVHNGKEG